MNRTKILTNNIDKHKHLKMIDPIDNFIEKKRSIKSIIL